MDPRCPYFGRCGGCTAQHIPYELQLENKKKSLAAQIRNQTVDISVHSGAGYSYRNRMDFIFHSEGLGFRAKDKWWQIIDIKECPISEERINKVLSGLRKFFERPDHFDIKNHSGTFRYAVVRTSSAGASVSFVLNSESSRIDEAVEKIKEYAATTDVENIIVTYVPAETDMSIGSDFFVVKGSDELSEEYLGKRFSFSVQGFFQNNHAMAERMQKYVHDLIAEHGKEKTSRKTLLDLYGGVGTFGVINSDLFKEVITVESVKECTESAEKNFNSAKNIKAVTLDARKIRKLELKEGLFVITDPPRSGMHPDTISELKKLKPEVIIYISCNIQQLGKDLPKFTGYKLKSAALFDLFPQTPHCEGVVELVRKEQ